MIKYEVKNCPKKCRNCLNKNCNFKTELVNIFEQIESGNWNDVKLHQMIKFRVIKHKLA